VPAHCIGYCRTELWKTLPRNSSPGCDFVLRCYCHEDLCAAQWMGDKRMYVK